VSIGTSVTIDDSRRARLTSVCWRCGLIAEWRTAVIAEEFES
jgi:hypothetical protein